jgi:uncharacterized RDD family membrane protein YckC
MSQPQYGSWGARAGALLLDGLIIGMVAAILVGIFGINGILAWLLWLAVSVGYHGLLMSRSGERNGQTLGKQAASLRVVRKNGQPITFTTGALRDGLFKGVVWSFTFGAAALVDGLWPLGEREKRSLHDLAMGTHVVDTNPAPQQQHQVAWTPPMPQLAPPIARHLHAAYGLRGRIVALDRTLDDDMHVIVGSLERSAGRAQQLWDALSESSPDALGQRIAQLEGSGKTELIDALRSQQAVQQRMQDQLERYRDEFERVLAEMETIRGHLVSASASTDAGNREQLTATVRALRDETHALADGTMAAYGQ